jgi:hypothetical protein
MWCSEDQMDDACVAPLQIKHETPASLGQSIPPKGLGSSGVQPQLRQALLITWGRAWRLQRVFSTATAFAFSALAPAVLMTAIWSDPRVAPMVFVFTLVIALSHAVLLGLPIFLIVQSRGWIGITACVVLGFAIGAVPAGILTFPVSGFELYASAWAGGTPAATDGLSTAAIWVSYIKPLMYLGLLGAFGGLNFWVVLMSSGTLDRHGEHLSTVRSADPSFLMLPSSATQPD